MSEHAPTPWRVEEGTLTVWGACDPHDESTYGYGYPVLECRMPPRMRTPEEAWFAAAKNADRIVTAVNCFDGLVESLDNVSAALETLLAHYGPSMPDADRVQRERVFQDARETIRKARGL